MDPNLHHAISSGDFEYFLSLINDDPSLLSQTTVHNNTTLHVAAAYNQRQIAEEITRRRLPSSNLYATNSEEDTALHLAARLGSVDVAEHLITRGDLEADDEYKEVMKMVNLKGDTALHDAVRNGHSEIAKLLVEKCPELAGKANKSGESPLFLAVEEDYLDIASDILRVNSKCFYGGRDGATVLHAITIRTLKRCSRPMNAYPFENLAKFVLIDVLGRRPSWEQKSTDLTPTHRDFITNLLNKFPNIIREADTFGWLPLHYAANLGSKEVVELILKKEPSLAHVKDKNGMSSLHIAAKEGHVGVLATIVGHCPDSCEVLDVKHRTALHVAVVNTQVNVVSAILAVENFMKMVNRQDIDGNTALHLAAINGHFDIIDVLATSRRVANNIINNDGFSPNDIIRLSPKFDSFGKALSIRVLEANGGVQGISQVLGRKATSSSDGLKMINSASEKQKEKVTELETNAVAATTTRKYNNNISEIWKELSNANLVVAALIATVTFSASFQVPGGYEGGMALLRDRKSFKEYFVFNALSFVAAVASMFLTFVTQFFPTMKFYLPSEMVLYLTGVSLLAMVLSFFEGMNLVIDQHSDLSRGLRVIGAVSYLLIGIFLLMSWGALTFAKGRWEKVMRGGRT